MSFRNTRPFRSLAAFSLAVTLSTSLAFGGLSGAIYTTDKTGTIVNQNIYALSQDVYLSGGPQNKNNPGLPDGTYYFQITDPSGGVLLSTDIALCRQLLVSGGRVAGATGPPCKHTNGTFNSANGTLPVQMFPFSPTPNNGDEYKAWLIAQTTNTSISGSDPKLIIFDKSDSKTDNFKVQHAVTPPPPGSCQGSSSVTVLVAGRNVAAYVPKGNWESSATGVLVLSIEGANTLPTTNPIPTASVVNSCASNPVTGKTVCTANNTDVYVISGLSANPTVTTLNSDGTGLIGFTGGVCTNCGVAMDAIHNKAVIGLSVAGGKPGFQFLNLFTNGFETPFSSPSGFISEDPLIDPSRNFLLSASENNNYEIVNVVDSMSPKFFENATGVTGVELDSSGEECSTGIALAPAEFSQPSQVYIADLSQATFTPGLPAGTWTAPSRVQTLSESILSAGASAVAVAQDTHIGIISGEFGGDAITAIVLPATSGSGTPMIGDYVTCSIGSGFSNGFDPHTVTAYQSPNTGDAIAVLANGSANELAVVDLSMMLALKRTVGGHGCASVTLPSTVVRFVH